MASGSRRSLFLIVFVLALFGFLGLLFAQRVAPAATPSSDSDVRDSFKQFTQVYETVEENYAGWRLDRYLQEKIRRLSRERIQRLIDEGNQIKLCLKMGAQTLPDADSANVIGEIPGTDPALKDEIVMLGGHFDSWHAGTGATDNAAGSAVSS